MNKLLGPIAALMIATATCATFVVTFYQGVANAQPAPVDAGVTATDAGAGWGSSRPSDSIDDPLSNPTGTVEDIKQAKRLGWGVLVLALLVVVARLLGRLGGVFKVLGKGKVALAIGAGGAFATTAFDALVLGGPWVTVIVTALIAGIAAWDAAAKSSASSSSSPSN